MVKKSKARGKRGNSPRKQKLKTLSSKLTELLSLRMPRCSLCGLDWFNDFEDEEGRIRIKDEIGNNDELLTLKCRNLLPLPQCKCETSLLDTSLSTFENDPLHSKALIGVAKEIENIKDCVLEDHTNSQVNAEKIINILIEKYCQSELTKLSLKHYRKKAMCKDCLLPFMKASNDVIEHDYRSNSQNNPKFSVVVKCTCCLIRFNARALETSKSYMYTYQDEVPTNGRRLAKGCQEHERREWFENVKGTIQFVEETKRLKKILLRKISCSHSTSNDANSCKSNYIQALKKLTTYSSLKSVPKPNNICDGDNGDNLTRDFGLETQQFKDSILQINDIVYAPFPGEKPKAEVAYYWGKIKTIKDCGAFKNFSIKFWDGDTTESITSFYVYRYQEATKLMQQGKIRNDPPPTQLTEADNSETDTKEADVASTANGKILKCIRNDLPTTEYTKADTSVTDTKEANVASPVTENILKWLNDDEAQSSDDCFSDDDCDDDNCIGGRAVTSKPSKRAANIIAPKEGEIKSDLIKRDPKFRQEVEDLAYITEKLKTREGKLELGIGSGDSDDECEFRQSQGMSRKRKHGQRAQDLHDDEELAKRLQLELNEQNAATLPSPADLLSDEELAKRLQLELNEQDAASVPSSADLLRDEKLAKKLQKREENAASLLLAAKPAAKNRFRAKKKRKKVGMPNFFETQGNAKPSVSQTEKHSAAKKKRNQDYCIN